MTTDSPVAVLFNTDGYEVNVKPNVAIPAGTTGILAAGSDGTNARYIKVDSSGDQVIVGAGTAGTPSGGVITIQGDPSGTPLPVSGTISVANASIGLNGSAIPGSSTQVGGSDGTNLQPIRLFDLDSGAGTQYVMGVGLRKASSGGSVEFGTSSDPIRIDPTGTTIQPVSGTVAATQSGTWTVQPGNTANSTPWLTTINQGGNSATVTGSNALKVDGSAVTQPVSGTVTANIGTSGALALDATLTGGTARTKITDGTNNAAVKAASTAPVAADPALVVAISPNSSISTNSDGYATTAAPSYTNNTFQPLSLTTAGALRIDGSATTQPVSGTVAATQSGTWTVQPGNTANTTPWLTTISQGGNSATVTAGNALKVDGSAVTQPVSGTVTANIGTTNGLALDATLTGGTARTKITDGTNNAAVKAASTAPVAADPALVVAISPNSNIVTNADGYATTAAPTYTNNTFQPLSLTTAGALRIDGSATTQPVSGTVTANIGTTGGLALDTTLAKLTISQGTALGANTQALVGGSVTTAAPTYTTGQINPLSLTTAGALRIDGSGTTQPVSGTVAATQSGTWTVQPGNTANTTPWLTTINQGGNSATVTASNALKVDGSAVTQPVSGTVTSNQGTANTLANAWSIKITDTTNGPVAVKAASTAAVATDVALVVAVSPNNTVTVVQSTAANLRSQTSSESNTGAAVPTQASMVGGTDGTNLRAFLTDTSGRQIVIGAAADGAAVTGNPVLMAGQDGTNAQSIFTDTTGRQVMVGAAATGAAVTGNPVLIGGSDGSNAQAIATTTTGVVKVEIQSEVSKAVYGAAVRSLSPPATPTDMITITGSGTKTIRVLRVILSATQNTGASQEFLIIKRSTANSGGTSSTATNVPYATSFAAASATVRSYTVNPSSLGTSVGTVNVVKFFVPAGGTAQRNDYVFDFSNNGLYPGIVLSGTSEVLALNFNGAALPTSLNIDCTVEWSEE
jgi:hypothetical protein